MTIKRRLIEMSRAGGAIVEEYEMKNEGRESGLEE